MLGSVQMVYVPGILPVVMKEVGRIFISDITWYASAVVGWCNAMVCQRGTLLMVL